MAARQASSGIGRVPEAAIIPITTEFRWQLCACATAARSAVTARRAKRRQVATIGAGSRRPSVIAIFSSTVQVRWVEAISAVRSGVTKPACTMRVASSSSVATSTSTRPGAGCSAITGRPA